MPRWLHQLSDRFDFSLSHDFRVMRLSPTSGSMPSREFKFPSAPLRVLSLSLKKINRHYLCNIIFKNSIGFHTIDNVMPYSNQGKRRSEGKNINSCDFLGSFCLYREGLPLSLMGPMWGDREKMKTPSILFFSAFHFWLATMSEISLFEIHGFDWIRNPMLNCKHNSRRIFLHNF